MRPELLVVLHLRKPMMFCPKEFCMILLVIMFQAWCIYYLYCNGGMYYYNRSNVIQKIKDLIKKLWSQFWRNSLKCLGVVFQLTMVALTSFLLKDTHTWTAIWIASSAIFAVLYSSYKACVETKRAELMPPVNMRYYLVLGYPVIPNHTIYNAARHWNPRGVVTETLSMDVENQDVVSNVAVVQQDVGIQSIPHTNAPEVTVQRDGRNQSVVADANLPEVATVRDLEDQSVAGQPEVPQKDDEENQSVANEYATEVVIQKDVEDQSESDAGPSEVAKKNDGGTQSIANANVPEIAIQRDVGDQSAAGQPEVPRKDDEENQSVANEYATEVVIQKGVEDQSESDAGPSEVAHKDEEYQSFAVADVDIPQVALEGC